MNKAEGIDKLGIGLYILICIFAIFNINSVDEGLGKKQLIFLESLCLLGLLFSLQGLSF